MKGRLIAKVQGTEIFEKDIEDLMNTLDPQVRAQYVGEEGKKRLLDEVIYQDLYYYDALDRKMDELPEFKQQMEEAKKAILRQLSIVDLLKDLQVTDDEVRTFYNQNLDKMKQDEVRASHILVQTEEEAKQIVAELESGKSFEEIAKEKSMCPSKEVGGDLNFFSRGMMVPEFDEAVFSMKVGERSNPVKTQFGYHIILKTDEKKDMKKFDDVKEYLRQNLALMKQNEAYMKKAKELENKFEVKRF